VSDKRVANWVLVGGVGVGDPGAVELRAQKQRARRLRLAQLRTRQDAASLLLWISPSVSLDLLEPTCAFLSFEEAI